MNRQEVALLLRRIDIYYEGRGKKHDPQERFEAFAQELADMEYQKANDILMEYIKDNHFPPNLADFIKGTPIKSRAIPTLEETQKYLGEREKKKPADPEVREAAMKRIREILDIPEGDRK